jgi:hypothetical protein
MTTDWTPPTLISQYAEPGGEQVHIPWDLHGGNFVISPITTDGLLTHIARSPKFDIRSKTYFLQLSGFNFKNLPTVLTGIEMRLTARRRGRIMDETIQLSIGNQLIGNNVASSLLDPIMFYGGSTDLWSTQNFSLSNVLDNNFGVSIRLQSHINWPHRDAAFIDAVELRIY